MAIHESGHVLAALAQVGIDTGVRRPFNFYLHFPSQSAATAVGRELSESGFRCRIRQSSGGRWLCLVGALLIPDDSALETVLHLMETMAEDFGGAFDGWETPVTTH